MNSENNHYIPKVEREKKKGFRETALNLNATPFFNDNFKKRNHVIPLK